MQPQGPDGMPPQGRNGMPVQGMGAQPPMPGPPGGGGNWDERGSRDDGYAPGAMPSRPGNGGAYPPPQQYPTQPGYSPQQQGYPPQGYSQPEYSQPGYSQPSYPEPGYPQQPGGDTGGAYPAQPGYSPR